MKTPLETDPSARLCEEVLAEGRRLAAAIQDGARQEGEAILARAAAQAETVRAGVLEAARRKAELQRDRILAGVPIEVARRRAARLEALLEALRERARRDLLDRRGFDYREALAALAAEALARMAGDAFVLVLAPGDRADFGETLAEAVRLRTGRPGLSLVLEEDPALAGGGLILRDPAGTQVWDDRLPVRLDRLWPRLRVPVARAAGLLAETGGGP